MLVFDNVSFIIVGLVIVCVVSLFCGNQEIVLMVVSGLLGFLAKDKLPVSTGSTESTVSTVDDGESLVKDKDEDDEVDG